MYDGLLENRLETRSNDALDAVSGERASLGARHAAVGVPDVQVDAVVDDGHARDFARCAVKSAQGSVAQSGIFSKRPREESPGQLGMTELVLGDALQDTARLGIGCLTKLLGREQGSERFADTPLGDCEFDHIGERHRRQAVGNNELRGSYVVSAVPARK
jgi:hypothetical protein